MKVAIIPARGGSKRIPGKNIKPFCGKPIIAYAIDTARESGLFDRIIVSTDDEQIALVANEYGAETPFARPRELADDFTPTADVIIHALNWLSEHDTPARYACCIYATAPFVRSAYLQQGFERLTEVKATTAFSVTTYPASIYRALKINDNGRLTMVWPEHELTRSNDLPDTYHDAAQFYWLVCKSFLKEKKIYGNLAFPIVLPRYLVQDIDTPEDWETAELMFELLKQKGL